MPTYKIDPAARSAIAHLVQDRLIPADQAFMEAMDAAATAFDKCVSAREAILRGEYLEQISAGGLAALFKVSELRRAIPDKIRRVSEYAPARDGLSLVALHQLTFGVTDV